MPVIMILIRPKLIEALKKTNMKKASKGMLKACPENGPNTPHCTPLNEISTVDLLKNYITVQLNSKLFPVLLKLFAKISKFIWKIVTPLFGALKRSIIAAVGSIPFVGGGLAAAAGAVLDAVFDSVKNGITKAFNKMREKLQKVVVKSVVKAIFGSGKVTDEALQDSTGSGELGYMMTGWADEASESTVSATQDKVTSRAKLMEPEALKEAAGQKNAVTAAGDKVQQGEVKDDTKDEHMEDTLDKDDVEQTD